MIDTDALAGSLMEQLHTAIDCADALAENFGEAIASKHYDRAGHLIGALLELGVDERLILADFTAIH